MAEAAEFSECICLAKNKCAGQKSFPAAGQVPEMRDDSGDEIFFVQLNCRAAREAFAGIDLLRDIGKSSAPGCESASTKTSQSPLAAAAPEFLARAIWLIASKTTIAPATRAISAVWSVELLSQTINSVSQPIFTNAPAADLICTSDSPIKSSSLKAGTTIEIFTAPSLRHPLPCFNARNRVAFYGGCFLLVP